MTQDDFVALARRLTFGGGLLLWSPSVKIDPWPLGAAAIVVERMVLDRSQVKIDWDNPNALVSHQRDGHILYRHLLSASELAAIEDEDKAVAVLVDSIRDAFLHEIEEGIRFDGRIVNDPHRDES